MVASGRRIIYSCQLCEITYTGFKTRPHDSNSFGPRRSRQKAHSVEVNWGFINIFIRNNVLAFVYALRFVLKIIAMLPAKSPIWPRNEFPGLKMNLQAWLAYKNILNFREKMTSALLSWKLSYFFFCFYFKALYFTSNNIITLNFYHSATHCNM